MNAKHSIRIDLDGAGNLAVTHRVTVEGMGHTVSHSREVELDDKKSAVQALKDLIETNRETLEKEATGLAISHVAAVTNKDQKGVKRVKLAGSLGAVGSAKPEKKGK